MAESLDSLSKVELIEYIEKLQKVLEDDDNEISRLTRENEQYSRRFGGVKDIDNVDLSQYIAEIDDLKIQQEQDHMDLAKLNEQLAESNAKYTVLLADKIDFETRVKSQTKRVDELEKELVRVSNVSKSASQQSQEFSKLKSETNKETIRLLQDIETLQEQNNTNLVTIKALEEHNALLEDVVQKLVEEKEDLASHKDHADITTDELQARIVELEDIVDQNQEKLNISQDTLAELQRARDNIQKEYQLKTNQLQAQLTSKATEIDNLKKQILSLSKLSNDNTGTGASTAGSNNDNTSAAGVGIEDSKIVEDLRQELEVTMNERDKLAERIIATEDSIEQIVAQRIVGERDKIRFLEKNIENLRSKFGDDTLRTREYDVEKGKLQSEVDELSNWKAVYEAGHGMQELARNQKKLRDHNRRLEIAMDQMNSKLGALMDANGIISQAFDRLKAETGRDPSFMYPEYILQEDMLSDKARLTAQVRELDEQVNNLETENIRLRKALKNQAGSMGEKSLESIRDNNVDILLENRSSDLIRENKKLKDDIKLMTLQLQHYDRDSSISIPILSSSAVNSTSSSTSSVVATSDSPNYNSKELMSLREDMQKLFSYLRTKSSASTSSASTSLDEKNDITNNISAILLSHNDALMKEIRELQRMQQPSSSLSYGMRQSTIESVPSHNVPSYSIPSSTSQETIQTISSDNPANISSFRLPSSSSKSSASAPILPSYQPPDNITNKPAMMLSPATLQGTLVLNKNLSQLNLPPEEWAQDVRDLTAQLIECLEQLHDREQELDEQKHILSSFEDHLISVKQQTTILYHDHLKKSTAWGIREKEYKDDNQRLRHENEDVKARLKRFSELTEFKRDASPDDIDAKLNEMTRKISIYEVNENILSRKYISLSEQLSSEQHIRRKVEYDMADLESNLKKRILYLEQYKLTAGSRLAFLQTKLDASVPQQDYMSLQTELEYLREEHLNALQREVDARVVALTSQEKIQELRTLRLRVIELESEITRYQETSSTLSRQLTHQQDITKRAIQAVKSSSDISEMISEMARYRGDAARMEVELSASKKRIEMLLSQLGSSSHEYDSLKTLYDTLQTRMEESSSRDTQTRKEMLEMKTLYDHGYTRDEADKLRSNLEKLATELDDMKRESARLKEIADIASKQAQTLAYHKEDHMQQLQELQEHCLKLESRGEDDILIGKLQRQLMSTKTSYKAFVRKYQLLQGNMRQRELAIRLLETRLDQREDMVLKLQESHRIDINALKKALRTVHNTFLSPLSSSSDKLPTVDQSITLSIKLKELSKQVGHFSILAENAVTRKHEKELEYRKLHEQYQELQVEKEVLEQKCLDYDHLLQGKSKQNQVASRLIAMSEEIRTCKMMNLQSKRLIQSLSQEKKHLEAVIDTMQVNVDNLEQLTVRSEVQSFLPSDISSTAGTAGIGASLFVGDSLPLTDPAVEKFYRRHSIQDDNQPIISPSSKQRNHDTKDDDDRHDLQTKEELFDKFQETNAQLINAHRQASHHRSELEALKSSYATLHASYKEREEQVHYYERIISAEGLPILNGNQPPHHHKHHNQMTSIEEQERLQEAASATISSLRSLLEDKNRMIDKLRERVEELLHDRSRKKSKADENADALLDRLQDESSTSSDAVDNRHHSRKKHADEDDDMRVTNQKLLDQLEQADQLLMEKSHTIQQLEEKLMMQINQKERAELRCGESIQEMERMKSDLIRLAQQLQLSEERLHSIVPLSSSSSSNLNPAQPSSSLSINVDAMEKKMKEMMKFIKTKDDKIKSYRDIIVKLKEEFIKSEEEKAVIISSASKSSSHNKDSSSMITSDELKELRQQIITLRSGLQQAKHDLEQARHMREKSNHARQTALNDARQLEEQLHTLQSENTIIEDAKRKCQKDLEDSKRKEIRLREKLKEVMNLKDGGGSDGHHQHDVKIKVEQLEHEVALLRTQNQVLRSTAGMNDDAEVGQQPSSSNASEMMAEAKSVHPMIPGAGHVLGTIKSNKIDQHNKDDDYRQQLHEKWEQEKKLQSRVNILEKRLHEKIHENEELEKQLQHSRQTLSMIQQQEASTKKAPPHPPRNASSSSSGAGHQDETSMMLEQARVRIFALEGESQKIYRQLEVEAKKEILSLQQEIRELKTRSSSSRPISASAEELLHLQQQVLDRDIRVMEIQFDYAAQAHEITRLTRRIHELESSVVAVGSNTKSTMAGKAVIGREQGINDQEYEVTIDTMKKVIEKLKSENTRLRKSSNPDTPASSSATAKRSSSAADASSSHVDNKKAYEKLQEELQDMKSKMKKYDDLVLKQKLHQQSIVSLRKQLQSKDQELISQQERLQDITKEKEMLHGKLSSIDTTHHEVTTAEKSSYLSQIRELKAHLKEQELEMQQLRRNIPSMSSSTSSRSRDDAAALAQLEEENKKLKTELQAFDMDFFDEIENLKYEHAEAIRKLRIYKRNYGEIA